MKSVRQTVVIEHTIKRSRFIGTLQRVMYEADAKAALDHVRSIYPDATHHCYAYIIGETGNIQKASDDKEPSKTAGFPMLDILKKNGLTDIIVIASRYFGGIKLGSGGLIRAYSKTARLLVEKADLVTRKDYDIYSVIVDYHDSRTTENLLAETATIIEATYLETITYKIRIEQEKADFLINSLKLATSGTVAIKKIASESMY